MIYTYFIYFKYKLGNNINEDNICLDLPQEISSPEAIKATEKFIFDNLVPNSDVVKIMNFKLLNKKVDDIVVETGDVIMKKGDING